MKINTKTIFFIGDSRVKVLVLIRNKETSWKVISKADEFFLEPECAYVKEERKICFSYS